MKMYFKLEGSKESYKEINFEIDRELTWNEIIQKFLICLYDAGYLFKPEQAKDALDAIYDDVTLDNMAKHIESLDK